MTRPCRIAFGQPFYVDAAPLPKKPPLTGARAARIFQQAQIHRARSERSGHHTHQLNRRVTRNSVMPAVARRAVRPRTGALAHRKDKIVQLKLAIQKRTVSIAECFGLFSSLGRELQYRCYELLFRQQIIEEGIEKFLHDPKRVLPILDQLDTANARALKALLQQDVVDLQQAFDMFMQFHSDDQLRCYELLCREEIIDQGIEAFLHNPAILLKQVLNHGRAMPIIDHLILASRQERAPLPPRSDRQDTRSARALPAAVSQPLRTQRSPLATATIQDPLALLDSGLSTCPTIERDGEAQDFMYMFPRIYSLLGVQKSLSETLCPVNGLQLSHDDPVNQRLEEQHAQTQFDRWIEGCGEIDDIPQFLLIRYYDYFYPRTEEGRELSLQERRDKDTNHAIYLSVERRGGETILSLFDPWGIDALDPKRRKGFIAFNNFVRRWAMSKGFTYRSLPEMNVKMQFPGAAWERGGVCSAFTGLQTYFSRMRIPPEKVRLLMVSLGHEGREKLIRQYLKVLVNPTQENKNFFESLVRALVA